MELSDTIRLTFVYTLSQEFARWIVSSENANTPAPSLPAHRISVPIFREEKHSTSHFH